MSKPPDLTMKLYLVSLFFLLVLISHSFSQPADPSPESPRNAMDHPVVIGQRPTGDHPVVIGQRPTGDAGISYKEHLAPLIFMVIAFLITIITGVVFWERGFLWGPADRFFLKSPIVTVVLAVCCALVAVVLLANVSYYISDEHPDVVASSHSHHAMEIWLGIAACLFVLLTLIRSGLWFKGASIFIAGACEMIVIIILLNIFPDHVYKMCNGQCVMRGSQAGVTFDLPCADNVAFMALHHATGIDPHTYTASYASSTALPHFLDYATAVPMHDPLYPKVTASGGITFSEPITLSLEETSVNPVATCSLFVMTRRFSKAELESPGFSFPPLAESAATLTAAWTRTGSTLTKTLPLPAGGVDDISHVLTVAAENDKVTYVTYKFSVTYTNPAGGVSTPPEDSEVTFVLQDFYSVYPDHPAPVYTQADMRDVMDLLFIPAQSDAIDDPLDAAFFSEFRSSCRSIIKDAIFQEPSIKYWRKHFNFWINPSAGRALDGRCGDCCHVQPANVDFIPRDIEFRALLHKDVQLDFTDHCNRLFSAEMKLVNDHNEKSSFLHELGHAAFGLSDEYPRGYNYQATDHLPNNWDTRSDANRDAPLRHKDVSDVVRLH